MDGFVNLLKPPGMSSGAAVNRLKQYAGGARIGHAGTLDPEAVGVLPVMLGRGTRLLDYFFDKSKAYVAEIAFSGATDTQDAQGTITEEGRGTPAREALAAVLPRFTGEIMQRPPSYSAVKKDGKRLYELARRGDLVVDEARKTTVFSMSLGEALSPDSYLLSVTCGGGTYIRTLCHDIGQALGCPAHMRFLLRTRVGAFDIAQAVSLEDIEAVGGLAPFLQPLDYPLRGMPTLTVPRGLEKQAINGVALPCDRFDASPALAALYLNDRWIAVVKRDGDVYKTCVGPGGTNDDP